MGCGARCSHATNPSNDATPTSDPVTRGSPHPCCWDSISAYTVAASPTADNAAPATSTRACSAGPGTSRRVILLLPARDGSEPGSEAGRGHRRHHGTVFKLIRGGRPFDDYGSACALLSRLLTATGSFSVIPIFAASPGDPRSAKKSALIWVYSLNSPGRSSS